MKSKLWLALLMTPVYYCSQRTIVNNSIILFKRCRNQDIEKNGEAEVFGVGSVRHLGDSYCKCSTQYLQRFPVPWLSCAFCIKKIYIYQSVFF